MIGIGNEAVLGILSKTDDDSVPERILPEKLLNERLIHIFQPALICIVGRQVVMMFIHLELLHEQVLYLS
jgi:hypothetical protein